MNTNTKRLFFTVLILGTLLSILTVTTVMASANDVSISQRQRDQDRDQLFQNDNTRVNTTEGSSAQHGSIYPEGSNSEFKSDHAQYQHQHRHCHSHGN